jgi:cystathionine beta-lyase/cystathionine gamma-synthase
VRKAPTVGSALARQLDGAKLLWLESPTNPRLDVCDIAELAEEAHRREILVAVDNTTPTVLGQSQLLWARTSSHPDFPAYNVSVWVNLTGGSLLNVERSHKI